MVVFNGAVSVFIIGGWNKNTLSYRFVIAVGLHIKTILKYLIRFISLNKASVFSSFEICFPQKYIFVKMQSVGIQPANLQFLFSSKGGPFPAGCIFQWSEVVRTGLSVDGLPLIGPVVTGNTNTKNQQGDKGEFTLLNKKF
jgi:hypothetical protein